MTGWVSSGRVAKNRSAEGFEAGSGLAVRHGPRGRGVFATRGFAKGEVIEACPTVELGDADVTGRLNDYVFTSVKDGDLLLVLGHGMLYNHSANPNVEYLQDEPSTITFHALRDVRPGDELTIDYGDEWWETRGLEPD
jgi:SET domain-containing protein